MFATTKYTQSTTLSMVTGHSCKSEFGYRYRFNGKEEDDEISGQGNSIAYEQRIYDSRLGRFNSTDPREIEYAWQSTYAYYGNSPISTIDFNGGGEPPAGEENSPAMMDDGQSKANSLVDILNQEHGETTPISIEKSEVRNSASPIPIFLPTRPSEIKLRKIGEAYYTNLTYEENYYDLQYGFMNIRVAEVSIPSLNIMIRARTETGRYRSKQEVQTEFATLFNAIRADAANRFFEGEFLNAQQIADYIIKDLNMCLGYNFGPPSMAQTRKPSRWYGADKTNLIYIFPY